MTSRSKWTQQTTRLVYENPWMSVHEDEVTAPGGTQHLYGHIHFKNMAVAILAVDDSDCILLVSQSRYTLGIKTVELPMGGAPLHEDPLLAAKRELREETGYSADHWTQLMSVHPSNSITDEVGLVFLATGLTRGDSALEETEDIELMRVPADTAIGMAMDGSITDAISVLALLRLALMRKGTSDKRAR
ncbi:MAG: NUDIX hydrolase [Pseudomonadota bacterium]